MGGLSVAGRGAVNPGCLGMAAWSEHQGRPPVYLSINLSTYLFVYLPTYYLSTCLSTCLPVCLYT